MKNMKKVILFLCCVICFTGCEGTNQRENQDNFRQNISYEKENDHLLGKGEEDAYKILNNNQPQFTKEDFKKSSFETYSELDNLGRCGMAYAKIGKELMPTEERGAIGQVKPTGWHTVKYDFIDGKYLYNRCHLIGYQLTGENANEKNLITGTRYLNMEGMLPFENLVADYIKETSNHVLYRVTPIYEGKNLIATSIQMEAYSIEDAGDGICYNVLVYNHQPGVVIDYATGESWEDDSWTGENLKETEETAKPTKKNTYIINISTKKFHTTQCSSVENLKKKNREKYVGTKEELIKKGYEACKRCNP